MLIQDAIRSMRELCVLRHLSINTEKSYTHWLVRYGAFLKDPKLKNLAPEQKMEAFPMLYLHTEAGRGSKPAARLHRARQTSAGSPGLDGVKGEWRLN